jgi:hypothetical protein
MKQENSSYFVARYFFYHENICHRCLSDYLRKVDDDAIALIIWHCRKNFFVRNVFLLSFCSWINKRKGIIKFSYRLLPIFELLLLSIIISICIFICILIIFSWLFNFTRYYKVLILACPWILGPVKYFYNW